VPGRHAADVPGLAPAALEEGDRQRRPWPARRLASPGNGGVERRWPGRQGRQLAGNPFRWAETARSPGPGADPPTAAAFARRTAGRPGRPDPHRDAATDRAALAS